MVVVGMIVTVYVMITLVNTISRRYRRGTVAVRSSQIPHLTRLNRRIHFSADPEKLGMTVKQLATLASLRDRGELPQQMLCDVLRTSQNTVVMWLNELEEAGFVSRVRDAGDRRKHIVAITAAGGAALERAELEMRRLEDEALAR